MSDERTSPAFRTAIREWWRPWRGAIALLALYAIGLSLLAWLSGFSTMKWEESLGQLLKAGSGGPLPNSYSVLSRYVDLAASSLNNAQIVLFALWAALATGKLSFRFGIGAVCCASLAWLSKSEGRWFGPYPIVEVAAWFLVIFGAWSIMRSRFGYQLTGTAKKSAVISGLNFRFSMRTLMALLTVAAISLGLWQVANFSEYGLIAQTYVTAVPIVVTQSLSAAIVLGRRFRPFALLLMIPIGLSGFTLWWASVAKYLWGWGVSYAPFWNIFWEVFPTVLGTTAAIILSAYLLRLSGYRIVQEE